MASDDEEYNSLNNSFDDEEIRRVAANISPEPTSPVASGSVPQFELSPRPPSNSGDLDERNQDQADYSELDTRSVAGPSWLDANWPKKTKSDWYKAVAVSFFNFSDVLKANQPGEKDNIAGNCKKCGKLVKGQRGTTNNWKTHVEVIKLFKYIIS